MVVLTKERVNQVLNFDEIKGEFTWKIYRGGIKKVGDLAGSIDSKGYRQITIDGKAYLAHRLVWLITHGNFPDKHIDHIDRNPLNIRPSNLRECTHAENHQNEGVRENNTSGVTGVSYNKKSRKWLAYININGARIRIGLFDKYEDAVMERIMAKNKTHTFHPIQNKR